MNYTPKIPDDSVNVTHKNPLHELGVLVFGISATLAIVYIVLGFFIDRTVEYLPVEYEKRIASIFMSSMDSSEVSSSPRLDTLLALIQESNKDSLPVDIYVLKQEGFNAFAAPGLQIFVLESVLDSVKDDQELSFIIGHELGHFKHKHHLKSIGRALVLLTISISFMGTGGGFEDLLGPFLTNLNNTHSQEQEREADAYGAYLQLNLFDNLKGATRFFTRLEKMQNLPEFIQWFSTHPSNTDRLQNISEIEKAHKLSL